MSALAKQRAVGNLEKYQLSKQLTKSYGTVNVTCLLQHAARPDGLDTAPDALKSYYVEQFKAALEGVVADHPGMRVAVSEPAQATAHFVPVTVDLDRVIRVKIAEFWDAHVQASLIAEECREEFDLHDATLPLWRFTVHAHPSRDGECLVTFSVQHVIGDGTSLKIFWQDFLKRLNGEACQGQGQDEMPPAFEKRNGPKMSVLDTASLIGQVIGKKLLPASWQGPPTWAGDACATGASHDTEARVVKLETEAWAKVCRRAKEHGVTPHAPLMTSLLKAWAEVYENAPALESVTPINCRHMCDPPVPGNEMGNFVGSYNAVWKRQEIRDTDFWRLAQRYQSQMRAEKREAAKQVFQLDFLKPYPEAYSQFWQDKRKNPMGRSGGLELSDLGKISLPSQEKAAWTVREIYFCQSAQIFTTALGVNTVTAADTMHATFCWQRGALHDTQPFINAFLAQLGSC